jgi:2-C-methyl-D-erythritol 2,4-cyclodiphosphate synthase
MPSETPSSGDYSAPANPPPVRLGIGHDTHRLVPGGPLRLGGIEIPFDFQLQGHSDADVLLHALSDALLGAAALADIGHWFPDTEPENEDRDSAEILSLCYKKVQAQGYQLLNADCIVFAEQPKIGPHRDAIQDRIGSILQLASGQVSVKAKTGEKVGEVGSGQVIQAQCVALLWRNPSE